MDEEAYCVADTLGVRGALGRAGQMEHQMARGARFTATAEHRHSWSFMSKPRPHRKFSVEWDLNRNIPQLAFYQCEGQVLMHEVSVCLQSALTVCLQMLRFN